MDTPYRIRLALPDDLPVLAEIERAAAGQFRATPYAWLADAPTVCPALLAAQQAKGWLWVVVNSANSPVGFAIVTEVDGEPHLQELDVHPQHQGRRLGAALIDAICAWARAANFSGVTLSTFRDIPWNGPYYRRLGFQPLAEVELGPELAALRVEEERRGLKQADRVCMCRPLHPPDGGEAHLRLCSGQPSFHNFGPTIQTFQPNLQ